MNEPSSLQLRVRNNRPHAQQLVLESWGDVHELPAGASVLVVVTKTERREIELELTESGVVLYGAVGDVIEFVSEPPVG